MTSGAPSSAERDKLMPGQCPAMCQGLASPASSKGGGRACRTVLGVDAHDGGPREHQLGLPDAADRRAPRQRKLHLRTQQQATHSATSARGSDTSNPACHHHSPGQQCIRGHDSREILWWLRQQFIQPQSTHEREQTVFSGFALVSGDRIRGRTSMVQRVVTSNSPVCRMSCSMKSGAKTLFSMLMLNM